MTCDHEPEEIEISVVGSTVEVEAYCRHCDADLWGSTELLEVGDHSVGDQFEGPEGRCWTILNPTAPGPARSPGLDVEQLRDPLEDRTVGVHLRAENGDEQWFQYDQFESIVGDLLKKL